MKHYLLSLSLFVFILVLSSCKKDIEGCTSNDAMNFNLDATVEDGSCIFAYEIAQGVWTISPNCDEYTVPVIGTSISLNEQLPETIDVQGSNYSQLYIIINDTQVNGNIDSQGNLLVPSQNIQIDMGFGPMDINVEGNGIIQSANYGLIDLTYSFTIETIPGFPISESIDCSLSLSK